MMSIQILFFGHKTTTDTTQACDFTPTRIIEVELSQPLSARPVLNNATGLCYRKALIVVRLHAQPLGLVELALDNGTLSAWALAHGIVLGQLTVGRPSLEDIYLRLTEHGTPELRP